MTNFVDNLTSLPTNKVNAFTPPGPVTEQLTATEYNQTAQAAIDLRTVILRQYSIMSYGGDPTNTSDNSTAFNSALTAIGSTPAILHIPIGTYKVTTGITIPSNVTVQFDNSIINQTSGIFIINGDILAPQQQIFEGIGSFNIYKGIANVRWFGAKGDSSTDDTTAIQTAFNSVIAFNSGLTDTPESRPVLWFPSGEYITSSVISVGSGCDIRGEKAIIKASTNDIFDVGAFRGTIRDMQFYGGANAIVISTGNADTDDFQIENCRFFQQTAASVKIAANSSSTQLLVKRCLFYNTNSSSNVFSSLSGDYASFDDCWVTSSATTIFNNAGSNLYIRGMVGVPGASGITWINCSNGSLIAENCRFGGEQVENVIVNWSTPASLPANVGVIDTYLTIRNCSLFSADGGDLIKFFTLPNKFTFEDNIGLQASTLGLYFDSTIPLHSRSSILTYILSTFSGSDNQVVNITNSDSEIANKVIANITKEQSLESGDLVYQTITASGISSSNCTVGNYTDPFGLVIFNGQATMTSSAGNYALAFTLPTTLSAGDYTVVFHAEAQNGPFEAELNVGGVVFKKPIEIGHNLISIPFSISTSVAGAASWVNANPYSAGNVVIDGSGINVWVCTTGGTSSQDPKNAFAAGPGYTYTDSNGVVWAWAWGWEIGFAAFGTNGEIANGTLIQCGRIRVFKHHPKVKDINTIILGTTTPSSGQWFVGDKVYNTATSATSPLGWVCTTAGTIGSGCVFTEFGGISAPLGPIGGNNTDIQFNNSGSLGGSGNFTWDGTSVLINGNLKFLQSGFTAGPNTDSLQQIGSGSSHNPVTILSPYTSNPTGFWAIYGGGVTTGAGNYTLLGDYAGTSGIINGSTQSIMAVNNSSVLIATSTVSGTTLALNSPVTMTSGFLITASNNGSSEFSLDHQGNVSSIHNITLSGEISCSASGPFYLIGSTPATGSVAIALDNSITMSSGKLVSFQNNGTEEAYIDFQGSIGSDSGTFKAFGTAPITLMGNNGASAGNCIVNSAVTLTSASLQQWQNNSILEAYVDFQGSVHLNNSAAMFTNDTGTPLLMKGNQVATGYQVIVDNATAATSGGVPFAVKSGGTELAHFDFHGNLTFVGSGAVGVIQNVSNSSLVLQGNLSAGTSGTGAVEVINAAPMNSGNAVFSALNNGSNIAMVVAGNSTSTGAIAVQHYIGLGSAPTVGTFNGNFGTVTANTVTGTDAAGIISFTTGTATTINANSALFTVTLNEAYSSANYVVMASYAQASGALDVTAFYAVPTAANTFIVYNISSITPSSSTTYKLQFITMGASVSY